MKLFKRLTFVLISMLILTFCNNIPTAVGGRQSRLSAAVAILYEGQEVEGFLESPGVGYVQAYMRFDSTLPDDVIIALDQEFYDGTTNPKFYPSGDWMSFVGIQRAGGLWIGAGTDSTMKGNTSSDRDWKIIDLKTRLKPDTWYLLRIESDFATRHFKSFTISGGGLDRTVDISEHPLDFPNKVPFNRRAVGYFFSAIRNRDMVRTDGSTLVYFDDLEGGVVKPDGVSQRLYYDGFENQTHVPNQPTPSSSIDLKTYKQGHWYLERDESVIGTQTVPFARSGKRVGFADANLH